MFQIVHNFWVEQLPFFNTYPFVYFVLDLISIIAFFRIIIIGPMYLVGGRNKL